jgi:hypothetical protein
MLTVERMVRRGRIALAGTYRRFMRVLGALLGVAGRAWRPAMFAIIAVIAALTGLALKPNEVRTPAAEPGGVVVLVDRPAIQGVVVITMDETVSPNVLIEPYLRAVDGKPIRVALEIVGPIKVTGFNGGKIQQFSHYTVFYAQTGYPKSLITTLAEARDFDAVQHAAPLGGSWIEGDLEGPPLDTGTVRDAIVRQGTWVNVGAFRVRAGRRPGDEDNIVGLGRRAYAPSLQIWEGVTGINQSIDDLQLEASQGMAPTLANENIYWHVTNVSDLFVASATYLDLVQQDKSHSNEFLAGVLVGVAGAATIAFLQELPKSSRRRRVKSAAEKTTANGELLEADSSDSQGRLAVADEQTARRPSGIGWPGN